MLIVFLDALIVCRWINYKTEKNRIEIWGFFFKREIIIKMLLHTFNLCGDGSLGLEYMLRLLVVSSYFFSYFYFSWCNRKIGSSRVPYMRWTFRNCSSSSNSFFVFSYTGFLWIIHMLMAAKLHVRIFYMLSRLSVPSDFFFSFFYIQLSEWTSTTATTTTTTSNKWTQLNENVCESARLSQCVMWQVYVRICAYTQSSKKKKKTTN